jgi:hypothetical protein
MQEERRGEPTSCEARGPPETSMVRRGSTVRVRQRALQERRKSAFLVCVQSPGRPPRAQMEPFMELSRRERGYEGWICSLDSRSWRTRPS